MIRVDKSGMVQALREGTAVLIGDFEASSTEFKSLSTGRRLRQ